MVNAPVKTNSLPSSGSGVIAKYAVHISDIQEESHPNRSRKQTHAYLHLTTSQPCSTHHSHASPAPQSYYTSSPHIPIMALLQLQSLLY